MRKCINLSFIYCIAGILCGVFYREFTKFTGFTGKTTLAFTHLHLLALGMLLFLILALFCKDTTLTEEKKFRWFMVIYNIGLPFTVVLLFVRGIFQVRGTELSRGLDASISGMAGIGHTLITLALVFLFLALRNIAKKNAVQA